MKLENARSLAIEKMRMYSLYDWTFEFDSSVRRFGYCDYKNKKISISATLTELNSEERVLNTILHEIAHALAGHKAGHGLLWKEKAIAIGCDGSRLYNSEEVQGVEKPFIGTCKSCGKVIERHKRKKIACGNCCKKLNKGKFSSKYLFKWERK
jgi:predicted SprT family Zn-dependent metalloprotease